MLQGGCLSRPVGALIQRDCFASGRHSAELHGVTPVAKLAEAGTVASHHIPCAHVVEIGVDALPPGGESRRGDVRATDLDGNTVISQCDLFR